MKIKILLTFLLITAVPACAAENLADLNIRVSADAPVPEADIRSILAIRRPKAVDEKWQVDFFKGSIRIRRSHPGFDFPPGAAVEFWIKDEKGIWVSKLTA